MKIRPKIPILQGGNNIWYNGIQDYDPSRYVHAYDTSKLVNPLNFGDAWTSRTNGYGRGRYVPNPNFTSDYIKDRVENNKYYQDFTKALFNSDGTLSDVGKAYARLSDNLLPENSLARVYNGDQMRNNWTTTNNDTLGRPGRSFNDVKDYLWYERNDNLPGGRHNVFLNKGKRYFYVDNEGKYHWVSPEDAAKYQVSEKPVEYGWGDKDGVYWEDYEILGPKKDSDLQLKPPPHVSPSIYQNEGHVPADGGKKYGFDWNKLKEAGQKIFGNPDLYALGRLAGNLANNERVYDEQIKGIKPVLRQSYNTHRQVVGDEATKQAYYRRAAQGQTKAAQPFTSDADRQVAYMNEAKRIGDELRAQGDLADNQEIRRTSDESNQHQWANIQRDTEVANANIASINQANALRHNLIAQKHSAQWSSIDNFLQGVEYRKRQQQAEQQALNDQIYALTRATEVENDSTLLDLQSQLEAAEKKPENQTEDAFGQKRVNYNSEEIKGLLQQIKNRQRELQIETYQGRYNIRNNNLLSLFGKQGTKITYKKKDDLLYKSAKDVVEHFRKMSKLSSDAQNRKQPKIEKLTSHPKGSTKKYQQGGVAPFTIYKPVALGGETSTQTDTTTTSSKSSKDTEGKETLDLVKSLFKEILGKGLPVDVNAVYSSMSDLFARQKAFGNELSTNDIALLYLQSMQQLNNVMHSKAEYDKAKAYATQNDALNEFAVNALGHFLVQDQETGKISTEKSWKDVLASGKNPITNQQLLFLREYSPELVSRKGDYMITNVINNGMGINKIGAQIKALAGNIGSYEGKIEGLTQVESNRVKSGLQLLSNAPDGYYKHTVEDKNQQTQMKAAISYITNMLSPSQRAILDAHGGADKLIPLFLASQEEITHNVSFSPLTGKASTTNKDKDSLDKIKSNPLLAMQREIGGNPINYSLITRDSNTRMSVNGTSYPSLPKVDQDMSISKMLSTSGIDGIITSRRGITFGDQQIKPEDLNHIMYSIDGGGTIVTLPCKIVNGVKQVNLDIRESYEKAEKRALQVSSNRQSPEFIKALGEELKKEHLDSLLDSNGLPNKNMFAQFLLVEGYTTDKIDFEKDSQYVEKVKNPDSSLENRISLALSTDKKKLDYSIDVDDHWGWFEGTWDDIYRGTIFIPLSNNPNAAINSWGGSVNIEQSTELEELYQNANKSTKFNNNNSL